MLLKSDLKCLTNPPIGFNGNKGRLHAVPLDSEDMRSIVRTQTLWLYTHKKVVEHWA